MNANESLFGFGHDAASDGLGDDIVDDMIEDSPAHFEITLECGPHQRLPFPLRAVPDYFDDIVVAFLVHFRSRFHLDLVVACHRGHQFVPQFSEARLRLLGEVAFCDVSNLTMARCDFKTQMRDFLTPSRVIQPRDSLPVLQQPSR